MDDLLKLLDSLARGEVVLRWAPEAWVNASRSVPVWLGAVLLVLGALSGLFGSGRIPFRFVLAPLGALAGFVAGGRLGYAVGVSPTLCAWGMAGLFAVTGASFPPALLFALFGWAGALLGAEVAQEEAWAGAAVGLVLFGAGAVLLPRLLAVAVSSLAGAAFFGMGCLALLSKTGLAAPSVAWPAVDLGLALALSGGFAAVQSKRRADYDERAQRKADRAREKQIALEERERDARFKAYSKKVR